MPNFIQFEWRWANFLFFGTRANPFNFAGKIWVGVKGELAWGSFSQIVGCKWASHTKFHPIWVKVGQFFLFLGARANPFTFAGKIWVGAKEELAWGSFSRMVGCKRGSHSKFHTIWVKVGQFFIFWRESKSFQFCRKNLGASEERIGVGIFFPDGRE